MNKRVVLEFELSQSRWEDISTVGFINGNDKLTATTAIEGKVIEKSVVKTDKGNTVKLTIDLDIGTNDPVKVVLQSEHGDTQIVTGKIKTEES